VGVILLSDFFTLLPVSGKKNYGLLLDTILLRAVIFSFPTGCGTKVKKLPNFLLTSPFDDPFQIHRIRIKPSLKM
jgi:hypothetical protein